MRSADGGGPKGGRSPTGGPPPSAARFSKTRLAVGSGWRKLLIRLEYEGNRQLARPPHHRPPDEAVHELSKDTFPRGRRGEGRVFDRQRRIGSRPIRACPRKKGAERPAAARSARALLGRRGRADPEGRARHPGDRRARRDAPAPSRPQSQHPPHAGAAHPGLARASRARAGRDLPPGARARPAGPVRLHRREPSGRHHRRARRSIIGSITSGWPSPASSTPTSCSAARASWRWPKGCRTRCGRSAARRASIAATACRRRSAI